MNELGFTIEMLDEVADRGGLYRNRESKYKTALEQFAGTDKKTMKLNCPDSVKAITAYTGLTTQIKKHKFNMAAWKRNHYVYVIKL